MKTGLTTYLLGAVVLGIIVILVSALADGFELFMVQNSETESTGDDSSDDNGGLAGLPGRTVTGAGSVLGDALGRLRGAVGGIL
mgnify:CR=1 FL=1